MFWLRTRLPCPLRKVLWCRQTSSATPAAQPMPLWIDCDAGVDDAQALLVALADRRSSVQGISAVHGNTRVSQVADNVARVLISANR